MQLVTYICRYNWFTETFL